MSVETKHTPAELAIIAAKLILSDFDEIWMKMRNYDKSKVGHYFNGSHLPRCMRTKSEELAVYAKHIEEIFGELRNQHDMKVSVTDQIIEVLLDMTPQATIDFVDIWKQIHSR